MRIKKLILLILLFVPFIGNAQDSKLGNWWIYYGDMKIKSNWNWHSEVQYRNYNFIGDLEQLLLRTGLGYNLTENNNNILLGYGYILSQNYIDKTLYVSAFNEIFISTDGDMFDRNRVYAGLGYRFSKKNRIELGYMNQFLPNSNRDQLLISSYVNF